MRSLRSVHALMVVASLLGSTATAQENAGAGVRRLSLDDALALARENSPSYLATRNDLHVADWDVRQAYGALTPSLSASGGISWQGSGDQSFGSFTSEQLGFANQPSFYFSSYNLGVSYRLDRGLLYGPAQAKALRAQTEAQIRIVEVNLDQLVTQAYLEVLRQSEEIVLAEQELERAQFNLRLATAQRDIGTVTALDVQQAEVQAGRAEVTLLLTANAERTGRLRLLQQMGVDLRMDLDLITEFGLAAPQFEEATLYPLAIARNPTLEARRQARFASDHQVTVAKSAYWPSLSLSAGVSGFTREASNTDFTIAQAQASVAGQIANCEFTNDLYSRLANPLPPIDCTQFRFTDASRNAIIRGNDAFPFSFQTSPPSASLSVTIPIFQGLSRQRQVEAAQASRSDAEYQIREQELSLQAEISIGVAGTNTAYQAALLEERNQAFADEQLRLALERYRVGAISFIDLIEAETVKAQADRARVTAIFAYHDAITNLEAVVGTSLRNPEGTP